MGVVIIVLIAVLVLLLAGNIFLVLIISKKIEELEKRNLQVEALKCRIIVLKRFVETTDRSSMQEYLISRFCNENLYDFFMKNTDLLHFRQSENLYTDEVYFDVGLNVVKSTSTDDVSFWE